MAGVAHEINTPVGITLTTASHLGTATSHIIEKVDGGTVKKSDFQAYLDTAKECSDLILSNAERAANLIHSFKQVAVDQTSEARRSFQLQDYLNEVITSLKPRFKHANTTINVQCEEDILLDSYPGSFAQVITNLMVNSLVHGFENRSSGKISIEARRNNPHYITLTLSDDGKGIPPENLSRVFDPSPPAAAAAAAVWGSTSSTTSCGNAWAGRSRCTARSTKAPPSPSPCPAPRRSIRARRTSYERHHQPGRGLAARR